MGERGANAVIKTTTARVQPPKGLSRRGREYFREIVDGLRPDHFADCDIPILANYVKCVFTLEKIQRQAEKEPFTLVNNHGNIMKHPIYAVLKEYLSTLTTLSSKLRLNPSSRYQATQAKLLNKKAASKRDFLNE